jgi:hypothetical protein
MQIKLKGIIENISGISISINSGHINKISNSFYLI